MSLPTFMAGLSSSWYASSSSSKSTPLFQNVSACLIRKPNRPQRCRARTLKNGPQGTTNSVEEIGHSHNSQWYVQIWHFLRYCFPFFDLHRGLAIRNQHYFARPSALLVQVNVLCLNTNNQPVDCWFQEEAMLLSWWMREEEDMMRMSLRSPAVSDAWSSSSLASVPAFGCPIGMYSATCSYPPFFSLMILLVSV